MGRELSWPDAEHDIELAQSLLHGMEAASDDRDEDSSASDSIPPTLSLIDRFDTVLETGRQIASALSREAIFAAVQQTALTLLRGEQCIVAVITGGDRAEETAIICGDVKEYSRTLLREALEREKAVIFSEAALDRSESFVLSEVRSAICAPIFVRGRIAACFYVTHGQIAGLFGEDELRLAEFVGTIAGAALENAENFADLQQMTRTLENRVQKRTADLERRSQELARSNAELQQFAHVASHDLQEPLRTVISYCQILKRRYGDQLDAAAGEFLEFAVDGAERMKTLIKDLLTFARVDTRGVEFRPTDCAEILNAALANLRTAIEETDTVITHDDMPRVMGDPTQLMQVFQNLIGNAVKFRAGRRPRIHVGAERRDGQWLLSVRDNGIGMLPEDRERVFLIFQRLHSRREYEGTGIGLAVCKKTIERHGGQIWVESELDKGSTFYFTLPRAEDADY
jgi:signal transduction histidine kinase